MVEITLKLGNSVVKTHMQCLSQNKGIKQETNPTREIHICIGGGNLTIKQSIAAGQSSGIAQKGSLVVAQSRKTNTRLTAMEEKTSGREGGMRGRHLPVEINKYENSNATRRLGEKLK